MSDAPTVSVGINPFNDVASRNWLAETVWKVRSPSMGRPILLFGSGPFEMVEFARFLADHGISCYAGGLNFSGEGSEPDSWGGVTSSEPPLVVLGEQHWLNTEFTSLFSDERCQKQPSAVFRFGTYPYWIERCETETGAFLTRSHTLRDVQVICQEALLACLVEGLKDPANLPPPWPEFIKSRRHLYLLDIVREHLKNDQGFPWPTTEAQPGNGGISNTSWPDVGLLRYLGYSVGTNGVTEHRRREVLGDIFGVAHLPNLVSPEYIQGWGSASSGPRLRKMAESIAAFCRNAKRRADVPSSKAIQEWESDLDWLRRTFYDGRYDRQFPWPKTSSP